jgi:hypothetical protein
MSYTARQNFVQTFNIIHEELVNDLLTSDCKALMLSGIQQHAIFKYHTSYPITNETIACIPLSDVMFQSEELTEYVYPSKAAPYVQFTFDTYTDNIGRGRSWIE